ncbi:MULTISPECIES: ribonuclease III domain-containing protein [unclassified Breznakia]|uniref:Mini-ribonuclease 3 n=1 Tax=unclassified Breznakia TaxID=2623764 RepID=UPI002474F33B|nr:MULTISPECIES: ribonuclease III domain-containing protein [unclassified Breznakia]MDH6366487.1 ribonuclease-3 family protein [Breznakia sp. PH1-1]MDH6403580.1 ribonuclease-3 family protein [Breznakia sp. PF1-11]MDH6411289.1 ribonuclease-3 family protein [Breznakia sp. PFB1-11]MDH6413735.1 ribonuclease-3 family protein [Breznakia sp. PFB1-14]MDH6415834.1 ribonuclease-3 family protein [Breznakia sp. PFB1-4]
MELQGLNGTTLAYIGDALYSLQIREYLVEKGLQRPNDLQKESVKYVSAVAQAKFLQAMLEQELLTTEEQAIVKRGRNTNIHSRAKNADMMTYRFSTGFEALWGYLYLSKQRERIDELLKFVLAQEV